MGGDSPGGRRLPPAYELILYGFPPPVEESPAPERVNLLYSPARFTTVEELAETLPRLGEAYRRRRLPEAPTREYANRAGDTVREVRVYLLEMPLVALTRDFPDVAREIVNGLTDPAGWRVRLELLVDPEAAKAEERGA